MFKMFSVKSVGIFILSLVAFLSWLSTAATERNPVEGDVRLSGMKPQENRSVGRVEIYHDGAWGTISSTGWRKTFSKVVCRQLGLSDLGLISYKDFGPTDNEIWLEGSSITCNGNETRILDCNVSNWNCSGCNHTDDIAIACQAIRLVGGPSEYEGRVEMSYRGVWGTVCDDGWDDTDAGVVCRQLDLSDKGKAIDKSAYGEGTGRILLRDVECTGSERYLDACSTEEVIQPECEHFEDASVKCQGVRLVGGESQLVGRVQMYFKGRWGRICDVDGSWDNSSASIVCRRLGLSNSGLAVSGSLFGESTEEGWKTEINCNGSEESLRDCRRTEWTKGVCPNGEDAWAVCSDLCLSNPCQNGAICIPYLSGYVCKCPAGYVGPTCEDSMYFNEEALFRLGMISGLAIVSFAVILLVISHVRERRSKWSPSTPTRVERESCDLEEEEMPTYDGIISEDDRYAMTTASAELQDDQGYYGNDSVWQAQSRVDY